MTLKDGHLLDDTNRLGYIASNGQLQFDRPIQSGGKYEGDFSIVTRNGISNYGLLALRGSTEFKKCPSGKPSAIDPNVTEIFYNLYEPGVTASNCKPCEIMVVFKDEETAN